MLNAFAWPLTVYRQQRASIVYRADVSEGLHTLQGFQVCQDMINHWHIGYPAYPIVIQQPGIGLCQSHPDGGMQREQDEGCGVKGGTFVDDDIIVRSMDYSPHFSQIDGSMVQLVVGEGNDAVDRGMAFEKGGYPLVEDIVNLCSGKITAQSVQERSGQNSIAQLAESDDKYVLDFYHHSLCLTTSDVGVFRNGTSVNQVVDAVKLFLGTLPTVVRP